MDVIDGNFILTWNSGIRQKRFFHNHLDIEVIQIDEYMQEVLDGERGKFTDLITKQILNRTQKELKDWNIRNNGNRRQNRKGFREVCKRYIISLICILYQEILLWKH